MNFISVVQKLVLIDKTNMLIDGWRDGWKNIEFRNIYG